MTSTAVALRGPTDDEIEAIRRRGSVALAQRKEVQELAQQIEGMQWGAGTSVMKGTAFTAATRQAFAQFCLITRANPLVHVDVLGGKPYLNAQYWADHANQHPLFHRYEQRDLSPSVEQAFRDRAKRHREAAKQVAGTIEETDRIRRALDAEDAADDIAMERARWSPPAGVAVVIETTIWRISNSAPLDAIRAGNVSVEPYLIEIKECNWAGGKAGDPVGNNNPGLTARTRSFRRAATKAFSAWNATYDQQIQRAEEAIEAEFEIVQEDAVTRERIAAGPQVVSTAQGEPERGDPRRARALPVDGEPERAVAVEVVQEAEVVPTSPSFDLKDARARLFATLNDAGHKGAARKTWAAANGFPESTGDWRPEQFDQAVEVLTAPVRDRVLARVKELGENLEDVALVTIGQARPEFLKHWNALDAALVNTAAPAADDDEVDL